MKVLKSKNFNSIEELKEFVNINNSGVVSINYVEYKWFLFYYLEDSEDE